MKKTKIFLITLILVIVLFSSLAFIHFKFFKGDVDERGNFYRYYSTSKMNIYTDKKDGHKYYKVNNNTYVFLKNLKFGDYIGMPNVYGCAQFAILQNDKAIVFHHSSSVELKKVNKVINKYIKNFNNRDDVYVSILFAQGEDTCQIDIENMIKKIVKEKLGKNVIISKSLYKQIDNNKSYMYQYKAKITDNGFENELIKKKNFLVLRRTNEILKTTADVSNRIRIQELYNDYFLVAYADKKIVLLRRGIDENIPVDLFSEFGNNKPQIHLILPLDLKSIEIRKSVVNLINEKFPKYTLKVMYYKNKPYTDYYTAKITQKGLVGQVKRYEKNAIYRR